MTSTLLALESYDQCALMVDLGVYYTEWAIGIMQVLAVTITQRANVSAVSKCDSFARS